LYFQIPVGADDAELEEHIIQHLAAAAAVRRSHRHHNRSDGHQSRSGASSHPHFLVLSADERTISGQEGDYEQAPAVASGRPLRTLVEQERTRGLADASSLLCVTIGHKLFSIFRKRAIHSKNKFKHFRSSLQLRLRS
jgi:E3 ubiquitin-protein ligase RHF